MSNSHGAMLAFAYAMAGRTDLTEDELERVFSETLRALSEDKREVVAEWVLGASEKIEQADVDKLMAHLDAMGTP